MHCSYVGQGQTRLYVNDAPIVVSSAVLMGLPVPDAELAGFTPEQRASLGEYARLVGLLKDISKSSDRSCTGTCIARAPFARVTAEICTSCSQCGGSGRALENA